MDAPAAIPSPLCTVVIPHLRGSGPLRECLAALHCVRIPLEIILVDNASTDGSTGEAERAFPRIRIVRSAVNRGYAGGCNLGLENARGRWCVFLNDDAVVTDGAIENIVDALEGSPPGSEPIVQPVLHSWQEPGCFDYAGGAGGLIDRWGYPFALGRIFDLIEEDSGQYARSGPLAWASGCCLAGATETFRRLGGFEESFFAHFEEIDLCWRHRRQGGRIAGVPGALVRHRGAATLPVGARKNYLNFRNNLWTLRRNLAPGRLAIVLGVRAVLDTVAIVRLLVTDRPGSALAAARGWWAGVLRTPWRGIVPPRRVQDTAAADGVYRGCLPCARWLRGVRTAAELLPRTGGWVVKPEASAAAEAAGTLRPPGTGPGADPVGGAREDRE